MSWETRVKLSKAKIGHFVSEEAKAKMSKAQRSRSQEISAQLMGHIVTEETRDKLRAANLGKVLTKEHISKISNALKGRIFSQSHRDKLKLTHQPQVLSEEHKALLRAYRIGVTHTKETKAKLSKAGKRNWRNPLYKEKQIRAQRLACSIHPNKPETIIMDILESICPGEFKFVGDGQVIIAGKNPDFINVNGHKQIIELFGDYWHGKKARCYEETEKGRIKLFKQYGFDTLIIWERELKTPNNVADRIANFTKRNCFERLLRVKV